MWVFSLHLQWQILERRWEPSNEQIMFPMLAFLPKWHITLIAINGLRKRRFATWIARWLLCSLVAFARRQEHEKTLCLWKYFRSSLCIGCFHSGMDSKPRGAFKKNVFWLWTWRRRFVKRSIQPSGKAYQLIIWECKMWLRFCSETWQDGGSSWRSSRWNGCKGTLLLSLLLFFVVFFVILMFRHEEAEGWPLAWALVAWLVLWTKTTQCHSSCWQSSASASLDESMNSMRFCKRKPAGAQFSFPWLDGCLIRFQGLKTCKAPWLNLLKSNQILSTSSVKWEDDIWRDCAVACCSMMLPRSSRGCCWLRTLLGETGPEGR